MKHQPTTHENWVDDVINQPDNKGTEKPLQGRDSGSTVYRSEDGFLHPISQRLCHRLGIEIQGVFVSRRSDEGTR